MRPRLLALLALLSVPYLAACGDDNDSTAGGASEAGPVVVATTTQAADLARHVAGDQARVTGLLQPNADPHGYELRPDDVEALADASLIVRSGGDLDEWLDEAIESSGTDAEVITLMDSVETIEGGHGHEEDEEHAGEEGEDHAGEEEEGHADGEGEDHAGEEEEEHADEEADPHWWQDPRNARAAVGAIEEALSEEAPAASAQFAANAERFGAQIEAMDAAVATCWDQVPEERRKLVTTHDALGYYAERYGLDVIGTVIPSLSTQGQPSAGEIRELGDAIRSAGVDVIFAESSVNSKVEQAVARATGARIGRPLWADTLGPPNSDGATYLESIAANTQALVDGLGGGNVTCALPTDGSK